MLSLLALASITMNLPSATEIFKVQKCNQCHIWTSQLPGKPEEGDIQAPDLSHLSKDVLNQSNPKEFLTMFLQKQIKLRDKFHRKRFKGTDEELKTLIQFLLEQKHE